MSFLELMQGLGKLTKSINLLQERHERHEKTLGELRDENALLRKEVAGLTTRIAVLEENRKTTAAEVKAAMTETLAAWELQQMREQLKMANTRGERRRIEGDSGEG